MLDVMDDEATVFELQFFLIEMGLNKTQSAAHLYVGFIIEHKIIDRLISVKINLGICGES